ncbi:unnamed protein product [Caenorhabditis bovis]|uniref:Uncharacterized protein n=1 Tax=Caenorhabditis bovis TaxID=2654633 RepID=A0A8S1EV27_9PELO|nr:unnamed protein product [Caenorhabditis bovis]
MSSGFAPARTSTNTKTDEGEKTEDDVDYEMPFVQMCDGPCQKLVDTKPEACLTCGHFYCDDCSKFLNTDSHSLEACTENFRKLKKRATAPSPPVNATHEVASPRNSTTVRRDESVQAVGTCTPKCTALRRRSTSSCNTFENAHEKIWYTFIHDKKPLAVCMTQSSTYGDLLRRIALCLNVNLKTHDIIIKIQASSSESSGEDKMTSEPVPIGNIDEKLSLYELQLPRSRMLIVQVQEKRRHKENDDTDSPHNKSR